MRKKMNKTGFAAFWSFFSYFFKNYKRSYRYFREIIVILIFHIFFWGFLYSQHPENEIWTVFGVFALLLNLVTVPSVFYLEKRNSFYLALSRPNGRLNIFYSKFLLIFLIDFAWVILFTLIYGIRFWDGQYFLLLFPRLGLIAFFLLLSTSLLSLSFTYKPWIAWLLLILLVFGSIVNKTALFPIHSLSESYIFLTLLLPPFLEILMLAVHLKPSFWGVVFLCTGIVQILLYLLLNGKLMMRKNFV